jgi:predicted DsbA family dithiol-disulfide isomerase
MTTVEVFADVMCPFTHVGLRRVVDELGDVVEVRVRAWPLEWVNGDPMTAEAVAEKAATLREQLQIGAFSGLRADRWPATTVPALNLIASAYERSAADGLAVSLAVRDALFERGVDIGDVGVLAELAADHDLPVPEIEPDRAVLADYEDGRRRGVRGSPDFFVEGQEFFCPSLDIGRDDAGHLVAHFDSTGFDRFIAAIRGGESDSD